ncbi:MAG: uroporphyrinogen decarboxylase family protein [Coriobacteriales bacterium]
MAELKTFSKDELARTGKYPVCGTNYGWEQEPIDKLNTPITPKENWRRFISREEFSWVPDVYEDMNVVYPDLIPDNVACGYEGGVDAFGALWVPNPDNPMLPAFIDSKNPVVGSLEEWRQIEIPDVDSWDWKGEGSEYLSLSKDRPSCGVVLTGFYERMISLCSYEEAAASLYECPEDVQELLDVICDHNIALVEHLHDYCGCDTLILHDDWGTQRSMAFSEDALREFFLPRVKRVVNRAHELDIFFILHSCGSVAKFVPAMIEAGVDMWEFNYEAVQDDIAKTIKDFGDQIFFHGYIGDIHPFSSDNEEFAKQVEALYDSLAATGACSLSILDYEDRGINLQDFRYEMERRFADKIFGRK